MANKNIVREDVVQIGFEVEDIPFRDIIEDINNMRSSLTETVTDGENSLTDMANAANKLGKEMTDAINSGNNEVKELTSGARNMSSELKKSADKISESFDDINNSANTIKKSIDTIKPSIDSNQRSANSFLNKLKDIASAGIDKVKHPITTVQNALGSAKKAAEEFVTKLRDIGKTSEESSETAEKSFSNMASGLESLKSLAGGLGIALGLKSVWDNVNDNTKAINQFRAATGVSSEEAKQYGEDIKNLYKNGMGDSILDVSSAMIAVKNNTKMAGEEISKTAYNALLLSDTFDFDVNESVRSAQMLMSQFGLSGNEAYNLIVQGAQNGLNKNGDLLDTINEYSVHYKQLGFSAEEMFNSLVNGAANGTFSVDKLGDTVKEFGIRVKDGSDTTIEGFKIAGLSASEMATKFGKGGETAKQAFIETVNAIKSIQDPIQQNIAGVNLFGTMWEDLGADGVFALANINGEISGTSDALKELSDIKYDDASSALTQLARTINVEFADAASIAVNSLIPAIEWVSDLINENSDVISKAMPYLLGFIGTILLIKGILSTLNIFSGIFGGSSDNNPVGGLLSIFKDLANVKPTTVLKGIANMMIIIGGLTVLAVGLMALAPYVSALTDIKSIIKLISVITVLGIVGSALAALAGLVGNIPVSSVALGLANIAIIVTGMSALFLLIGAVSLINFDINAIMQIIKIIAVLGTVGTALSVFAGIAGMIPIPAVLLGIANIAIVIGGITAVIIAFGALSKIPNFDEFISTGGETLAQIFNVIGNIAGSLIGGVGEGISNSLPMIGENLSAFAEAVEPMFTILSGADVSGIGSFFTAIGGFILTMTGNDILSIFTGGLDLVGLGGQLTEFANSAEGFFIKIATFPENGFSNAALLFQSISDIGNVPNTGGIAQWFSGTNDFEALAKGLQQLSSDEVMTFFNKVSSLSPECFNNAKSLFQSISDIGNVPNTGGIAQWFSGTNDFEGMAQKLPPFGESMAKFYNSISSIEDFSKISSLFEAMKGIGEAFPNTGGIAQWFSGENDISGIGTKLKDFGDNTKEFFSGVSALNVDNLKGVFEAVKLAGESAQSDLSSLPDKGTQMTTFMNNAKGFFDGAGEITTRLEAVNSVATTLQNFFNIISGIVNTSLTDINSGLQTTVMLITTSASSFNAFGVIIVTSTQMGAMAFVSLQTEVYTSTQNILTTILLTSKQVENIAKTSTQNILSIETSTVETFNNNLSSGLKKAVIVVRDASVQIKSEIDKLKNAFNFSWTLPEIKLPHFKINGKFSINPPSVPSFGVEWYRDGGIMTNPTMFGINNGKAMVGGEAGAEAILPLDKFWTNLKQYTEKSQTDNRQTASNFYDETVNQKTHKEYNTYSPIFNLSITGSNEDRIMERKVKKWVKEAMSDIFESMSRRTEL